MTSVAVSVAATVPPPTSPPEKLVTAPTLCLNPLKRTYSVGHFGDSDALNELSVDIGKMIARLKEVDYFEESGSAISALVKLREEVAEQVRAAELIESSEESESPPPAKRATYAIRYRDGVCTSGYGPKPKTGCIGRFGHNGELELFANDGLCDDVEASPCGTPVGSPVTADDFYQWQERVFGARCDCHKN